nr:Hexokinase domain containing protein [Haemonchus contortus]
MSEGSKRRNLAANRQRRQQSDDGIFSDVLGSISSLFGADATEAKARRRIESMCSCFVLNNETLEQVMTLLEASIEKGLKGDSGDAGALKMLPTYVRAVPNGEESGDYLALDLGGTNFRILLIRLNGREAEMTGKVYSVPQGITQGSGETLFDHIAECMARFMEEQGIPFSRKLPLGFTFSFPCQQEGLTSAKLIRWTKGFKASGCEGVDVCKMLKDACNRRSDIEIDVVALLNDTVGTLMACAFKENTCQIGVIVGTGTNACYMEQIERIPKLKDKLADDGLPDEMIMNTEWGAFGDDGALRFIHTKYDREVDKNSVNPGKQIFEKMISGMYLGELARVALKEMAQQGLLFGGQTGLLEERGRFSTRFMSDIGRCAISFS